MIRGCQSATGDTESFHHGVGDVALVGLESVPRARRGGGKETSLSVVSKRCEGVSGV